MSAYTIGVVLFVVFGLPFILGENWQGRLWNALSWPFTVIFWVTLLGLFLTNI